MLEDNVTRPVEHPGSQAPRAPGMGSSARQAIAERAGEPRHFVLIPDDGNSTADLTATGMARAPDAPSTSRVLPSAPPVPLRVLVVEDSPADAALLLRALRDEGYAPEHLRVDTARDLREALGRQEWDVVFSDHAMPSFSAPEALEIVKKSGLVLPFIIVSGTIGEETAVEAMRAGADDYLMKGRMARLAPALQRGLRNSAERRARSEAEAALRRRDAILQATVGAAEKLLRNAEWEQSVLEVLARLGLAMDVGRIYVLEHCKRDGGVVELRLRYEWVAPGTPEPIAHSAREGFSRRTSGFWPWEGVLDRGGLFYANSRQLAPAERELLEQDGVLSFACVPVFVGQSMWGLIGFDEFASSRDWSPVELDALKSAGDILGAAIQRRRIEERSDTQARRLAGLRALNVTASSSLDLGVTLTVLLEQITSQLGVDAADVLLFHPTVSVGRGAADSAAAVAPGPEGVLEFFSGRGFRTASFRGTRLHLGEGYAGQAAQEGRSLHVPDLRGAPGQLTRASGLAAEAFVAYYAIPLISKGQVKGVLELFHRSPLELERSWLEFAETLAAQAALAIDHAMLFSALQSSALRIIEYRETSGTGGRGLGTKAAARHDPS